MWSVQSGHHVDGEDKDAPNHVLEEELIRIHVARGDLEGAREVFDEFSRKHPDQHDPDLEALVAGNIVDPDTIEVSSIDETKPEDIEEEQPEFAIIDQQSAEEEDIDEWAAQFDWGDLKISFEDVAGLDDVKRQVRLRIINPMDNKEIYQAFDRKAGGGILLYGPPGCGKTFIARATAGECGARFISVGIHDIVDKYWGESEKMIHALFENARRRSPTVLFFDEFDALGSTRGGQGNQFWKTMVDQLLQEMDGVRGSNDGVLVFAATNMPWSVDQAFRRPCRFDRMFFVPPPDRKGRQEILQRHTSKLPGGDSIPIGKLVKQTSLMTGADLKSLCERASEDALERSLDSGKIHPVSVADFQRELRGMESRANEWLSTARNYARYANESGQYDHLQDFLKRVKKW